MYHKGIIHSTKSAQFYDPSVITFSKTTIKEAQSANLLSTEPEA